MTLVELIRRKHTERFKSVQEGVINGCRDWAEYRYLVGYMRGMYDFMADIEPYLKSQDDLEEEDNQ